MTQPNSELEMLKKKYNFSDKNGEDIRNSVRNFFYILFNPLMPKSAFSIYTVNRKLHGLWRVKYIVNNIPRVFICFIIHHNL